MPEQSTCKICTTYQGKHNSIAVLTYERHTEQLQGVNTENKILPLGAPRVKKHTSHFWAFDPPKLAVNSLVAWNIEAAVHLSGSQSSRIWKIL